MPPRLRRIIGFFAVIASVLVGVALFALRTVDRAAANSDWVNHTHAVILESQGLRTQLVAGDASFRAFLLTGDAREQAAARSALAEVEEHLEILRALGRGEAERGVDLTELARLTTARLELVADLVARRGRGAETPAALVAADLNSGISSEIQRRVDKLKEQQMALLAGRDTASYLQAQQTRWLVWAGVMLDVFLLGGVVWLIRHDLETQRRAVVALETANRELDAKVGERTAELLAANDALLLENVERRWTSQALEHQLRYDRLIIDSINDLVLVLTKAMNISRVNPAALRVTGFGAPDVISRPLDSILELQPERPEDPAPRAEQMAYALKAGREVHGVGLLRRKESGRVAVRVTLCPLRDGDNVVGGIVILELLPRAATSP